MAAGLEGLTVQEWIVSTLSESAALATLAGGADELLDRIWEGEYKGSAAKDELGFWWISFTVLDPQDIKVVSMFQVMSRVQFQMKVVCRGDDYTPAAAPYQIAHMLLESQLNQPTSDGIVLTSQRLSGFQFLERTTGMEYAHLGGTYETLTQ